MNLNMQEPQLNLNHYTPGAGEIVRQAPVGAPDISVVMAVKNGERFLEKSIRSILGQTLTNFELIVVDDGSDDRTAEILDRFGDARMRIVTQPNRGLAAALNRAVSLARATLVARMDADDVAVPERLEKQLEFLASNPEVGVVGSATTMINENDDELREWVPAVSDRDIRKALIRANQFAHASVMFRNRSSTLSVATVTCRSPRITTCGCGWPDCATWRTWKSRCCAAWRPQISSARTGRLSRSAGR